MNRSSQQIIEFVDALYTMREQIERVRESVELLKPLVALHDYEATWRLSRALFFLGQETGDENEAREFHKRAVAITKRTMRLAPQRVEGYFWRGVNLALLANLENSFHAARHAWQAKRSLRRAARIDPAYHGAGPLRVLARLSHKLPRVLGGSTKRAQAYFEEAIELAPANTVTRLYFAEMLIDTRDKNRARTELIALLNVPIDPAWNFEAKRDRHLARELLKTLETGE